MKWDLYKWFVAVSTYTACRRAPEQVRNYQNYNPSHVAAN